MKNLFYILILFFSLSCKRTNKAIPDLTIEKSTLTFPTPNEICTQGTIVSAGESKILFKWNPAKNAEKYELILKNLVKNDTTTFESTNPELEITLPRNTPFAWFVISKSSKTNNFSQSDIWKFYNAGPGVINYTPFPATILSPLKGQNMSPINGKVTLRWEGNDVDWDKLNYDIYFGTSRPITLYKSNFIETTLKDVPVVAGTSYYWKIITRDIMGNTSDSGEFQFKVN